MARKRSNENKDFSEAQEIIASMARLAGKHRHIKFYKILWSHHGHYSIEYDLGPWVGIDGDLALEYGGWDDLLELAGFLRTCLSEENGRYLIDTTLARDKDILMLPSNDVVVVFSGFDDAYDSRFLKQGYLTALLRPQRAGAMLMMLENKVIENNNEEP